MTPEARGPTLVLSGGGAKAAAHVGVARALAEAGITPGAIVGTSMGAVVGAALAAGRSPAELAGLLGSLSRRDVASVNPMVVLRGITARAVFRAAPLRRTISRLVGADSFADLGLPVTVTAVDIDSGDLVLFGEGGEDAPLVDALYASCALPVYYPPTVIGGRRLVDGGLRAVLPLAAVPRSGVDQVIAVDVGPGFDERNTPAPRGIPPLVRAHGDTSAIMMAASAAATLRAWREDSARPTMVYLRPDIERGATFEVDSLSLYEERGYQAMQQQLAGA